MILNTNNLWGYNFDTESTPRDKAIRDAKNSKSNFHTIMVNPHGDFPHEGDANVIWEFHEALKDTVENLILLVRFYNVREGNWQTFPSANSFAKALSKLNLPPSAVIDARANESSLSGSNVPHNKAFVEWELDNLKAISDIGLRYAVGAFSTGTPHESLLQSVYGKLWQGVHDNNGAIDMHLYGVHPLEAGETHPYDLMLNESGIRQIYTDDKRWDNHLGWLVGRIARVEKVHQDMGIPMPDVLVAETILDRIGTVPDTINEAWKQRYGIAKYNYDNRGILTWERHLKAVFPELTLSQSVEKLLIHVRKNILYMPYIRMAFFGHNPQWGYPYGSHKESGHNVEDDALLDFRATGLARVNTYPVYITKGTPMQPYHEPLPSEYTMEAKTITSLNVTNIRSKPDGLSDEIIKLEKGTNLDVMISDKALWFGIGWSWRRVEYDNKVWYIAETKSDGTKSALVINDRVDTPPIDTPDETEPPTSPPDAITQEQLNSAVQTAVNARLEAILADEVVIDLPLGFTSKMPRILAKPFGLLMVGAGKAVTQAGYRLAGIVTVEEIAAQGYSNVTPIADDITETTLTDEILNGADGYHIAFDENDNKVTGYDSEGVDSAA